MGPSVLKSCPQQSQGPPLLKDRFIADIYSEASKLIGSQVRLCGWVDNIRDH